MLKKQAGFIPLIAVLVVLVLAVAGLAFYQSNRSNLSTTTSPAPSVAKSTPASTQTSDAELVTKVISDKCTETGGHLVAGPGQSNLPAPDIQNESAMIDVYCAPEGEKHVSGYIAILKKIKGNWQIIYSGQQPPDNSLGIKYNLPRSWYNAKQ